MEPTLSTECYDRLTIGFLASTAAGRFSPAQMCRQKHGSPVDSDADCIHPYLYYVSMSRYHISPVDSDADCVHSYLYYFSYDTFTLIIKPSWNVPACTSPSGPEPAGVRLKI